MKIRWIAEATVKNIFIMCVLIAGYVEITSFIVGHPVLQDYRNGVAGDTMVAVSIVAVTACFGNFAFTYERTKMGRARSRILSHITTGLLMYVMGMSLLLLRELMMIELGQIFSIDFMLGALYVACVGYDLWDVERGRL